MLLQAERQNREETERVLKKTGMTAGRIAFGILSAMILLGLSFIILYPLLFMCSMAFRSTADISDPSVIWIPRHFTLQNLSDALRFMKYGETLKNTFSLGIVSSLLQIVSCALVGYGLARFRFRGRGLLFALILVVLLVPPSTILTPLYVRFNYMNLFGIRFSLINTYWPFVLMSLTGLGLKNGLYIYLVRQFFRGMPDELEESAYIDGAGPFRAFRSVMLPNARNILLVTFIFSLTWQWTDNAITPMFLPNLNVFATVVHGLSPDYTNAIQQGAINSIAALLIMAPLLVIYLFLQRRIIQGVESSGIVG